MANATSRLFQSSLAAVLLTSWLLPASALADAPRAGLLRLRPTAALVVAPAGKASVLALEGDDPARASALSKALQTEFAARGVGGGREMSLAELKLTMGCDEPPSAACLGSGGKTLGVDRMVYGSLTKKGGGYALNLNMMEVGSATVQQTVNVDLGADALADGVVQATAKDIVVKMIGPEAAAPPPTTTTPDEPVAEAPKDNKRKWVWGKYDAPKWKKAGLAASAALTVASLGLAIGTFILIRKNGKYYKDLVAAAERSDDDDINGNDIDPHTSENLCMLARRQNGGNEEMAGICDKADTMAKVATAGVIATGIFAASTLVFTTLLFVHKDNRAVAKLKERGFNFGVSPARGGAMFGAGMRF